MDSANIRGKAGILILNLGLHTQTHLLFRLLQIGF